LNEVGGHGARRIEPGVGARNRFRGRNWRWSGGLRRFGGLLRRRERRAQIERRLPGEGGLRRDKGGQSREREQL